MDRRSTLLWITVVVMAVVAILYYLLQGHINNKEVDQNEVVTVLPSVENPVGPAQVSGGGPGGGNPGTTNSAASPSTTTSQEAGAAGPSAAQMADSLAKAQSLARAKEMDSLRKFFVDTMANHMAAFFGSADQARLGAVKLRQQADSLAAISTGQAEELAARQKLAQNYRKAADLLVNSHGAKDKLRQAAEMLKQGQ